MLNLKIQESEGLLLEMLAMSRCYLVEIMLEAKEYYNSSLLPFIKSTTNTGDLFPFLNREGLYKEVELIDTLKVG